MILAFIFFLCMNLDNMNSNRILLSSIKKVYGIQQNDILLEPVEFKEMPVREHIIYKFTNMTVLPFSWNYIALHTGDKEVIFFNEPIKGFERFIKEERYIIDSNIAADQFIELFLLLTNLEYGSTLIKSSANIRFLEKDKQRQLQFISEYKDKIFPPRIKRMDGYIEIEFWTWNKFLGDLTDWCLTVSREYNISYKRNIVLEKAGYFLGLD